MLSRRDINYISDRLCAPAEGAGEAIDRLRERGQTVRAAELMDALKVFTDACRRVRYEIEGVSND